MILSAAEISRRIELEEIRITPYNHTHLNPNSYNLCLAPKLLVYKEGITLDPSRPNKTYEINLDEKGYELQPGILYLGSTVEYTESHNLAPMLEGRSSYARLGLSVHSSAGFGDIGFCGHWTLELSVVQYLRIYPGIQIAQMSWHTVCGEIRETYKGKYQQNTGVQASKSHEDYKG